MAEQPPKHWSRTTKWRQGSVLPVDALTALGLVNPTDPEKTRVVVIGHDCDVANDDMQDEPYVEVIVGRLLLESDGNYTRTKSPRKLHLGFIAHGRVAPIELTTSAKTAVAKARLAAWNPDPAYELSSDSLVILQHWLSVRYKRAVFPDEFNDRLGDTGLQEALDNIARKYTDVVAGLYFTLDPRKELGADDPRPYKLTVTVLYLAGDNPEETANRAEEAAHAIERAFQTRCFNDKNGWSRIELRDVMPISDEDLTVKHERLMQQWRVEHHSLRPGAKAAALAHGLKA